MDIDIAIDADSRLEKVRFAIVELKDLDWQTASFKTAQNSDYAPTRAKETLREICAWSSSLLDMRKKAVRDMLRNGNYKPAGRAKPSSEYLLQAAIDDDFPMVNFFVDAVNLASLKYLYPMSIFDGDKAGPRFLARLGAPNEEYIFNTSGQIIDLEDLLCICALALPGEHQGKIEGSAASPRDFSDFKSRGVPIANPVRDSMPTKLFEGAHNAIVVIYAPRNDESDLEAAARNVAEWCGQACYVPCVRILP
jgi:DNA/RNA-binding domain of Phe-tRNA-synthetase-like protein